jgi:hypothetical protein
VVHMLGHQRGGKGKAARGGGKDQLVHRVSLRMDGNFGVPI